MRLIALLFLVLYNFNAKAQNSIIAQKDTLNFILNESKTAFINLDYDAIIYSSKLVEKGSEYNSFLL